MGSYNRYVNRQKRRNAPLYLYIVVMIIVIVVVANMKFLLNISGSIKQHDTYSEKEKKPLDNYFTVASINLRNTWRDPGDELKKLLARVSINKNVVISVFDFSFLEQFYSFYYSSILQQHITNFIAFALDERVYSVLKEWNIPSVLLKLDTTDDTDHSSDFESIAFSNKVNMKTMAVLHVLECGYHPLLTDVDVVFFKNPFPYFTCKSCDIHIQREEDSDDSHERNSGFIYVRNTKLSNSLFQRAWQNYVNNRNMRQQPALNTAIDELLSEGLQMQLLSLHEFAPGWKFFEDMHYMRSSDLPCDTCVMFHNNWIVSSNAKLYRLKELGLFYSKSDYYSSQDRQYLTYQALPVTATIDEEENALVSALLVAITLHRVLILPSFACHQQEIEKAFGSQFKEIFKHPDGVCTFNSYWCIRQFDEIFHDYYRESISYLECDRRVDFIDTRFYIMLRFRSWFKRK